jgi:transcriptional regulator NrdR family protein
VTYTEPSKLPCPLCGSQDSRTLATRFYLVRLATWRRRSCQACGARFSTLESYADEPALRFHPGGLTLSTASS